MTSEKRFSNSVCGRVHAFYVQQMKLVGLKPLQLVLFAQSDAHISHSMCSLGVSSSIPNVFPLHIRIVQECNGSLRAEEMDGIFGSKKQWLRAARETTRMIKCSAFDHSTAGVHWSNELVHLNESYNFSRTMPEKNLE